MSCSRRSIAWTRCGSNPACHAVNRCAVATSERPPASRLLWIAAASSALLGALTGCESGLRSVDQATNAKLRESAEQLGGGAIYPEIEENRYRSGAYFPDFPENADKPSTENPPADAMRFTAIPSAQEDAASIARRFEKMARGEPDARIITFDEAILLAKERSQEYLFAEENYLLAALRLMVEERRWQLLPSNETALGFATVGDGSRFDNAMTVINDFGLSQRLPFGGQVSASFVAAATERLDDYLSSNDNQSADIVLQASIPLLRGFGDVAQEPLIQARRDLVYSARDFEQFRRDFYIDLAADYLQLVVQMQSIRNGELQVERSAEVEARTRALVQSGRTEPFQADLATQNTLFALDRLSTLRETHRLTLDRFKVRIGLRTEDPVRIDPIQFDLPVPAVDMRESVATAMRFRLTLQTARDEVEDFGRKVDVARNNLLGDLDLFLSNSLPTDPTRARGRLGFDGRYDDFRAELVFSAPLDRVTEDLQLRQAQILLERARRNALLEADNTAVAVRQAVRAMERAQFSVVVQQKNVEAALNRQAAIDAAPDRATARDRTEAVDQLRQAQDQLAGANRDLQLAILRYLNASGQLRISPEGRLLPIPGMVAEASDADAGATKEETP